MRRYNLLDLNMLHLYFSQYNFRDFYVDSLLFYKKYIVTYLKLNLSKYKKKQKKTPINTKPTKNVNIEDWQNI